MKLSFYSGVTCLVLASQAFAQPPPGPMLEDDPGVVQSFLPNMLATNAGTTLDARFDFTYIDDSELTLWGLNVHGQHITHGGAGVYASLPFAYISNDAADSSESGIGNIEIGGLYAIRNSPATDILLRGGIALDTTDDEDSFLVPIAQLAPKQTDWVASGLDTTWARVQGQLRHEAGNMRIGALAGFDIPVDGAAEDADGVLHLAGSLGFQTPGFGLGFGLAYTQILVDGDSDEESMFGFSATIDFPIGTASRLFGALGIPNLDDNEGDAFSLGVGIRANL